MKTQFENRFGRVSFRLVSPVQHVSAIQGADIPDDYKFDIETAEKLALITDNRGVQISARHENTGWRCYVVLHEDATCAAVADIVDLFYTGDVPAQELAQRATLEG